jgi:hypothetical protein
MSWVQLKCGPYGAGISVLHLSGLEWLLYRVTSCSVSQTFKAFDFFSGDTVTGIE